MDKIDPSGTSTNDRRQHAYWEQPHGFRRYDHPVIALFAEQRIGHLSHLIDLHSVESALDVGCGDGFSSFYLAKRVRRLSAVDRSWTMLARHPLRLSGRVAVSDARALPFSDRSFDLVYAWEVLHHISTPECVAAEMARVSRRYVLLIEPNRYHPAQFLFALADREHRWVLKYSRNFLSKIAERVGLEVVYRGTGGHVFPNRTPAWLAAILARFPYQSSLGISNWVLATVAQ